MSPELSFKKWRRAADAVMSDTYGINTDDAGLDEWLKDHWRSGEAPGSFVEWFGRKHDLTSKRECRH